MYVQNLTPLVAEAFCTTDARGAEMAVVVAKGTWQEQGGTLRFADVQTPIVTSPVYRGAPGISSLLRETDLTPPKPGTDCLLAGHACGGGLCEVDVRFTIVSNGNVACEMRAVVSGPRQWQTTLGIASIVGPIPFERAELAWESAFGGRDASPDDPAHDAELAENPVGVGFRARRSREPTDGAWLPQIEHPDARLSSPDGRPRPAGFGPVAPGWEPRRARAGTYGDAWRLQRAPLLPDDFDPAFYQSAPPDLVARPHLVGGEKVVVEGCTPRLWRLTLPVVDVRVALVVGARAENARAVLDTLRVDADAQTVEITWRAAFDIHGRVDQIDGVRVWAQDL